ncbi:MAG: OmpA family protein [Deltaproteobacteria bacterium]|nr:OmpA family protein [Deltaproteobacteria bacterium]
MRGLHGGWKWVAAVVMSAIGISAAHALDKRPDMSLLDPTTDGGRYMSVHDAETFLQGRWSVGFYLDYARKPLELRNLTTNQRFDIVRDALNVHFTGAYGITDWVSVGAAVPVTLWQVFFDPNQQRITLGNAPKQQKAGLGDIRLESKFRLLDIERYNIGVAVIPHMIFPSGRKGTFISGERWTPGVKFAVEGNVRDKFFVGGNIGYQYVNKSNQFFAGNPNAIINDLITLGLGARVQVTDEWAILGEVLSETLAKSFYKHATQSPTEILGGVQYAPQRGAARGLAMTLMGGGGITRGVGAPQAHVILGVTYPTPKIVKEYEPKVQVQEKIVITQKIHFAFDSAVIRPISYPILDDVAQILRTNAHIAHVQVEGHTDFIGGDEYNLSLSRRRAASVVDYLVKAGIERHRLEPVGYGESRPIADNRTDEGRARNRRTEFTIQ